MGTVALTLGLSSGRAGAIIRARMRAVILAGGEGTRLRPLTLQIPKPVVPVVDRPFLFHQLELLATAGVSDVVFSLGYHPEKIRAVFGDSALGLRLHYAVEATPLGTGGAVRNASDLLDDLTIVLNGDVLTDVDLGKVVARHRERGATGTLVLTPVPDPSAYGLIETDEGGRILRFVEKPAPAQITTQTINAGVYVLETEAIRRMPPGVNHSIERAFFPGLLRDGAYLAAYVHDGYWIDIGTPEKYLQVHRDILAGRFKVSLRAPERAPGVWASAGARMAPDAKLLAPIYVEDDVEIEAGAEVGPDVVLLAGCRVGALAVVKDTVAWPGTQIGFQARVCGALLARDVRIGAHVQVRPGATLGAGTQLPDHTRT